MKTTPCHPPAGAHPSTAAGKTFRRLALHSAIATAVLSGAYSRQSYAGSCVTTGPETFSCSGPADPGTDVQQSFGSDNPVITTEAGFGIETTSDSAFFLRHFGGISFTDNYQSLITGEEDGIYALAFSDITVTTTGTVTGITGDGIFADADGIGDLVVTAVNVNGGNNGVTAVQGGVGDLTVTTSGHVEAGFNGIYASVAETGSALAINAASITSNYGNAVYAANNGSGATSVTTTGSAVSTGSTGVYVYSGADTTDTTISVADVDADVVGIAAYHEGSGNLSITVGNITAGDDGIATTNDGNNGSETTIVTGDIVAGDFGIFAKHHAAGVLSITTGDINSVDDGIYADVYAGGTDLIITTGAITSIGGNGIYADNDGSGSTTITANGYIHAFDIGILGAAEGTDLTITAASVSADGDAIRARHNGTGAALITSSGLLTSTDGSGVDANNQGTDLIIQATNVEAADSGIEASNTGTGELAITGVAVFGYGDRGIDAYQSSNGTSLTINAHDVYGRDEGIYANHYGSGALTITTTGTVSSGSNGTAMRVFNSGDGDTVISTAAVAGGSQGGITVYTGTGNVTINAQGLVTGGNEGIYAENSGDEAGDITINATDVVARVSGIRVEQSGAGNTSVTATGSVSTTYAAGITVINTDVGGDITINAVDVSGGYNAVYGSQRGVGSLTITTTGDLVATGGEGIRANSRSATAGDITINAHNVTGRDEGIRMDATGAGAISVTTTGDVTGQDSFGIEVYQSANGGDVTVSAHNVSGTPDGIFINNLGAGNTTVTTTGLVSGASDNGINIINGVISGDIVVNVNDVYGYDDAVTIAQNGTGSVSFTSTGTISTYANIDNSYGDDGVVAFNTQSGGDITITVANINADGDGINADQYGQGNLTITATGTITTQTGDGIAADNSSTSIGDIIINAVDVTGGSDGIEVDIDSAGGNLFITSTGTATGLTSNGIEASSNDYGGDIVINAVNAYGLYDGIEVQQDGVGNTSVTASGNVAGTNAYGIYVDNDEQGGDISITAVDVSGGYDALQATQQGLGSLSITTSGNVTSATENGINAYVGATGTSLTINAVDTTGATSGIEARNYGNGDIAITSTGTASGESTYGIGAAHYGASGNIAITANNTRGGVYGIGTRNDSDGDIAITSTGTATGGSFGIAAINTNAGGNISITANNAEGGNYGVAANNYGSGALTITTTGNVSGDTADGIFGLSSAAGAALTISSSGDVSGGRNGIYARNEGSGDLTVNANNVSANNYGVAAINYGSGSVTVNTTGLVSADSQSALVINNLSADATSLSLSVNHASGAEHGIRVHHNGTGAIDLSTLGTVTGVNGHALLLERTEAGAISGTIRNSGTLSSNSQTAVMLTAGSNFSGEFVNSGNISGGNGIAVDASDTSAGMTLTQQAGTITGDILLSSGEDLVTITGGAINGAIVGQGHGEVVMDLGEGNSFDALEITNVRDYTIRSGRVNQLGDFSTASTTTTVESGATMAFSSTVNGSGAFVSDGNLLFIVDGVNAGKLIQAGSVTLNAGSSVTIDQSGQPLDFDTRFELIDASTLINNGTVVNDLGSLLFDFELAANGSVTTQLVDLGAISTNANVSALGRALTAQASLDRDINDPVIAQLSQLTADNVSGFERIAEGLSPSVSGAISRSAHLANTLSSDLLRDSLSSTIPEEGSFWVQGLTSRVSQDPADGVAGFEGDNDGLMLGYNQQWGVWRAGIALASTSSTLENDRSAADEIDTDAMQLMLSGGYQLGEWQLQGALSYATLDIDMRRNSPLADERHITGSTDGSITSLSMGVSRQLSDWRGISLRPLAMLQYSSLDVDQFNEQGGLNLTVDYDSVDTLTSELGLAAAFGTYQIGEHWRAEPQASVSWSHNFLSEEEQVRASFAQQSFTQSGLETDQDLLNIGAGVRFTHDQGLSLALEYKGQQGSDFNQYQGSISLHYAF